METVTATFTFTGADALSTSSFSIWKVSSEAATMLAGSESSWTEGEQTFTTTEGLNAGERLVLIWNSNNGGKSVTISDFSASYKKAVTATATTANLQSGFYRIKYVGSTTGAQGKYVVAPSDLPASNTSDQTWTISLGTKNESKLHRDVWYVENLGKADGENTSDTDGSLGDEADKDNKLVAAVNATTIAEGDYILAKNAEGEVVFGIIGAESDKNLAAGKAYLPQSAVPAAGGESNALRILWDDDTYNAGDALSREEMWEDEAWDE